MTKSEFQNALLFLGNPIPPYYYLVSKHLDVLIKEIKLRGISVIRSQDLNSFLLEFLRVGSVTEIGFLAPLILVLDQKDFLRLVKILRGKSVPEELESAVSLRLSAMNRPAVLRGWHSGSFKKKAKH